MYCFVCLGSPISAEAVFVLLGFYIWAFSSSNRRHNKVAISLYCLF